MLPCSYNLREDLTESYQQLIDFYNDNRTILVNEKAIKDSLEQVVAFASMFSDKNVLLGQLPEKCDTGIKETKYEEQR
nr:hypothetical protein [Candidatus Freyarchaeota archaeon]